MMLYLELPAIFDDGIHILKINPLSVIAYLENSDKQTAIYIPGGTMFIIRMSILEYEQALSQFFKEVNKLNGSKLHLNR
jgi:hypothetical protein